MLKWSPLLRKLHIWSFQLSQALKPSTAYRQKNSREADHKLYIGDVGFGVFSYKVTLLACGSGPAQIVFLYSTIKLNIYFVSYTLSTRFSLFIYRITSTILIASSLQLLKFVSGEYRIVFIIFINKAFNHTKFFK